MNVRERVKDKANDKDKANAKDRVRARINLKVKVRAKGKDKVGRASHVRKWFEQLRVFLEVPTKANGIQRLVYECMAFPTASNTPGMDDCVDALVWSLFLTGRPRGRVGKQSRR